MTKIKVTRWICASSHPKIELFKIEGVLTDKTFKVDRDSRCWGTGFRTNMRHDFGWTTPNEAVDAFVEECRAKIERRKQDIIQLEVEIAQAEALDLTRKE